MAQKENGLVNDRRLKLLALALGMVMCVVLVHPILQGAPANAQFGGVTQEQWNAVRDADFQKYRPWGRVFQKFGRPYIGPVGGVLIVLVLVAVAVYLPIFGFKEGPDPDDDDVHWYTPYERILHLVLVVTFLILMASGMFISFAKFIFTPGPGTGTFMRTMRWLHEWVAFPFIVALLMAFFTWIRYNIVAKYDFQWMLMAGGYLTPKSKRATAAHAPAGRFNAGQKFWFWASFWGGLFVAVSGLLLRFGPFVESVNTLRISWLVHAVVAYLLMLGMLAHLFAVLINKGSFSTMVTGTAKRKWVREHHPNWAADQNI